ncbi:thiamine ABC transporter substrate-binding protein [Williamsia sp.]|uniref:thiamine ABC transporter substrate-binding protein n=1 Tax=Williamsia sp. TaxID=1872085 RepID=UPI001A24F9A9|nr:thiamine ABC transporter substrate-binding protein [Williamsia sp.]MBJ7289036.1 thiamine ABC transporter substrate-binding protein [Williamsia sp.]
MQRWGRQQPGQRWGRRTVAITLGAVLVASLASACGSSDTADEVTLLTHDSFALPDSVIADFEKQSGLTLKIAKSGDAGQLASTISLTPGRPKADAVYGIDNTFASRPVSANALEAYRSPALTGGAQDYSLTGAAKDQLTPVDRGDVCINVDTAWFDQRKIPVPTSVNDLTDPRYKGDTVVMDPATSSPGMGFLLATIAQFPADWQNYWRAMRSNDVSVVAGWDTGYNQQFSGGEGKGPKPIVVSYASSPAANPATKALLDSCFRQVEYVGVLRGAANTEGAKKLVDFMLGEQVQRALPDSMYVYPVRDGTPLPESWARNAPLPESTVELSAASIAKNRESWQQQWRTIMGR